MRWLCRDLAILLSKEYQEDMLIDNVPFFSLHNEYASTKQIVSVGDLCMSKSRLRRLEFLL